MAVRGVILRAYTRLSAQTPRVGVAVLVSEEASEEMFVYYLPQVYHFPSAERIDDVVETSEKYAVLLAREDL